MNGGVSLAPKWTYTPLKECVEVLDGRRVPVNSEEREARLRTTTDRVPYYGATGQAGWIDRHIFDEELVLLGEDGAPFLENGKEKAYLIRGKTWVNNHAHVLRPISGLVLHEFLKHYLDIFPYREYVTGTTRLKLNQSRMNAMPIALAPIAEQRRIVERLDLLLSDLDAAVRTLLEALERLKRYRHAVLKGAVEGELSRQWRDAHGYKAEFGGTAMLPPGWKWAALGDIGAVTGGLTKNPRRDRCKLRLPYLRVANVYAGELRLDNLQQIGLDSNERERARLSKWDLLVVEGNGSPEQIGRVAVWDGSVDPCVHQKPYHQSSFCCSRIEQVVRAIPAFTGRQGPDPQSCKLHVRTVYPQHFKGQQAFNRGPPCRGAALH